MTKKLSKKKFFWKKKVSPPYFPLKKFPIQKNKLEKKFSPSTIHFCFLGEK